MSAETYAMMMGAIAMASAIASLFFFRFWKQTRDPLFAFFAAAFALDACFRFALALSPASEELTSVSSVGRLVTFALVIGGILNKNRATK